MNLLDEKKKGRRWIDMFKVRKRDTILFSELDGARWGKTVVNSNSKLIEILAQVQGGE